MMFRLGSQLLLWPMLYYLGISNIDKNLKWMNGYLARFSKWYVRLVVKNLRMQKVFLIMLF